MCGRYFIAKEDYFEILHLPQVVESGFRAGEVFPSAKAPVLNSDMNIEVARWGVPLEGSRRSVLHARLETVTEKRMFRSAFENSRVMVPTSGYFEWLHVEGKSVPGEKYFFKQTDTAKIYLAGLLLPTQDGRAFVVLTGPAGKEMQDIHDRSPLVLQREDLRAWLEDAQVAERLLHKDQPELCREYQGNRFASDSFPL